MEGNRTNKWEEEKLGERSRGKRRGNRRTRTKKNRRKRI
jgi:hypothetical protein